MEEFKQRRARIPLSFRRLVSGYYAENGLGGVEGGSGETNGETVVTA